MQKSAIQKAVNILKRGGLVAIPTETVYGLAADATNDRAVAHIFETKQRPTFNPLICHVCDTAMAESLVQVSREVSNLMMKFWPGPLTFVLPKKTPSIVSELVSAGLDTIAVRMPRHPGTREIIKELGHPVAAPSANISGKISPTSAKHVEQELGDVIDLVLDGGDCIEGLESTIITIRDGKIVILRPGTITKEMLESASSSEVVHLSTSGNGGITAPGQLTSHYAPEAKVRLNATSKSDNEYLLGFAFIKGDKSLSEKGDLREAAGNLFKSLKEADSSGADTIAVAPIPGVGIGVAINDRLRRAAAPRDQSEIPI